MNAPDIVHSDKKQVYITCKMFHEFGTLSCGHLIPHVDISTNATKVMESTLKLFPGIVNGEKINLLRDSGPTLVGVHKELVSANDYTGDHVDSAFLKGKIISAVLNNPCATLILVNVDNIKECSDKYIQISDKRTRHSL